MNVDLDKNDIICLIKGSPVSYTAMNWRKVQNCGTYVGGMRDDWVWSTETLESMNEEELLHLFFILKELKDK